MAIDQFRFQRLNISKFTILERNDLIKELKKRNISHRVTSTAILFDERYLKQVKDLVPMSQQ